MSLGRLETSFFSWIQLRKIRIVKNGMFSAVTGISLKQERELLNRLAGKSLIVRLQKGIYLVPTRIPPGGKWMPDEYEVIAFYMKAIESSYQIGGFSIFNYYGFENQISNSIFVYNTKISGQKKIGVYNITFIKTDNSRIGNCEIVVTSSGVKAKTTNKARTLFDAVYDYSRYNSIPKAYEWIKESIKNDSDLAEKIIKTTMRYGNQGTIRRIGYILDKCCPGIKKISELETKLSKSKEPVLLVPNASRKGSINKKWRIIVND
jgi:predicted transcriptional regulator of viral defense system